MILLDTSGVLAALDRGHRDNHLAADLLGSADPPRVLSPFVLAELDYLLATRLGDGPQRALLEEVARGAYQLEAFDSVDVAAATRILDRYADLRLGLADASVVVLAERYGAHDVLTLDQRHFRALHGPRGKPFRLLPADA